MLGCALGLLLSSSHGKGSCWPAPWCTLCSSTACVWCMGMWCHPYFVFCFCCVSCALLALQVAQCIGCEVMPCTVYTGHISMRVLLQQSVWTTSWYA